MYLKLKESRCLLAINNKTVMIYAQAINEIDDLISSTTFNALDEVLERLECCDNLLESWLQCLVRLKKFEKLSVSQVKSVSDNIVEVIKRSYEHCKARLVALE